MRHCLMRMTGRAGAASHGRTTATQRLQQHHSNATGAAGLLLVLHHGEEGAAPPMPAPVRQQHQQLEPGRVLTLQEGLQVLQVVLQQLPVAGRRAAQLQDRAHGAGLSPAHSSLSLFLQRRCVSAPGMNCDRSLSRLPGLLQQMQALVLVLLSRV